MKYNKKNTLELIESLISIESISMKTNLRQVHIAILIKRGKILDIASNFVGSRNSGCGYDNRTIHAERAVLKKVGDTTKLAGATLIVIRIAKGTKEIVNSEPCHSCQCHLEKCIKTYGLKQVLYST